MIKVKQKGNLAKTTTFIEKMANYDPTPTLMRYGEIGVERLAEVTPKRTGKTSRSWYYKIDKDRDGYTLSFLNSNVQNGWMNVALIIQYGHATSTGYWVEGRDYINPALQPVFDAIANDIWEEVHGKRVGK